MTPELWQRLKPLFHAALDHDPAERAQFIDSACAADPELKLQLIALVRAQEQGTEALGGQLVNFPGLLNNGTVRFQAGQVILDRFRIVRSIGMGGMGEVYEAVDLQLGTIALKTIRQDIAASTETFERFRQEVQLARRVSGPQVCRIHELFLLPASGGQPATAFLTMEFLDGVTLASKLRDEGPLARKEARPIALEICEGLRLIHEKGIIHRDLKSGNIMVCKQNGSMRTVLMDFGLAHDFTAYPPSQDTTASHLPFQTVAGAVMGTPAYMAPEQFEGGPVSPATDIYALGIILYELVTGIQPYSANTPIAAAIRRAKQPKPASSVTHAVPRHWDRIIERCLEFEPEKRFQSAAEVAKALRTGPANLANLKTDRPWVIWIAYILMVLIASRTGYLVWQVREQYHPGAEALRWYDAGVAALREGDNIKATRSLQEATRKDSHFIMAHARLAQAWSNLNFERNAETELLIAMPEREHLRPLDRVYLDAIHATVVKDHPKEIELYRQILDRLPADQKPSGYVDLGMAYERAGKPNDALKNYGQAASLDSSNPASYMHIAVLQSRQHNVSEADKAFKLAQPLLSAEMDQEGQADLNYELGYAANDNGDPTLAKQYLEKARDEAKRIDSVQLEIRALTQLSAAAYVSGQSSGQSQEAKDDFKEATDDAEQACDLAQKNDLGVWAADGYLRLASAQLLQGDLKDAEDNARTALRFSQQGQELRTEAGANLTLASVMNQRGDPPDQILPPAQAALAYYQQNGFFGEAASASLLLIRAERDQGEFPQALTSATALQELAGKPGMGRFKMPAEELFGTIYLNMEQYPTALEHFQNARSKAVGTNAKAYQALHCAETLWRLGRYQELDEMFRSVPAVPAFQLRLATIGIDSLLSRGKEREALILAKKTVADPATDADKKPTLELAKALAESRLQMKPLALKDLDQMTSELNKQQQTHWSSLLRVAEVYLNAGKTPQALDGATKAADHFAATHQLDSELQSLCIAASAAKILKDDSAYRQFLNKALDILSQLQQTWEPQALKSYLSRADLQGLMREANLPTPAAPMR